MSEQRFFNPAQPQTLQIAVFLLYLNGVLEFLAVLLNSYLGLLGLVFVVGQPLAAFGIANERRWAYILGIVMAIAPFAVRFWYLGNPIAGTQILNLLFEVALIALLVHPQSRDYQRIWFK